MRRGSVTIDRFPDAVDDYDRSFVVVAVDVFRATTTAVTALSKGRRCLPVATADQAFEVGAGLPEALYAGEMRGVMPEGFEIQNSPTLIDRRSDIDRPMVLLSSAGTELIWRARDHAAVFAACFRNYGAQADVLADDGRDVVLIGAGGRGEFRIEDKIGCALIARALLEAGFDSSPETRTFADRWSSVDLQQIAEGTSAQYLRASGQEYDLAFVLEHIDDVPSAYRLIGAELKETQ